MYLPLIVTLKTIIKQSNSNVEWSLSARILRRAYSIWFCCGFHWLQEKRFPQLSKLEYREQMLSYLHSQVGLSDETGEMGYISLPNCLAEEILCYRGATMTFLPILAMALFGNISELLAELVKSRRRKRKFVPYKGRFPISEKSPLF